MNCACTEETYHEGNLHSKTTPDHHYTGTFLVWNTNTNMTALQIHKATSILLALHNEV